MFPEERSGKKRRQVGAAEFWEWGLEERCDETSLTNMWNGLLPAAGAGM